MTDEEQRPDGPALHLVPTPEDEGGVADAGDADTEQADDTEQARDPLLARAERIGDLPLAERPAAFDGLNRAVVAELNQLEEG